MQIIHYIQDIFPFLTNTDLFHTIIRKCAHMSEYALLTISFIYGFYKNKINFNITCLNSLIFTFLYACSDELHQLFVGGRSGNFNDVLIDTLGGFVVVVIYYFLRRKKDGLQN